ncbi:helix-turn-helix domain-containing protein [Leucobacter allii]|uniref:PucR family transcriptional regulator n=1 Tax=Leucobacter allii TaxID=2932247 RepID=UPI001FD0CDDE|nr:helix-turn-helix domain-containing protein [Leucobacter allii]UOR00605.1 helix-turn-helix domain-containing protein [Leucobacter allii]
MALDLSAVVRAVGGRCLARRLPERTPVDGVAELEAFVVIGNPAYATLVTGSGAALIAALDAGATRRDALVGAVFVSSEDGPELRSALAAAGMTAILGTRLAGVALHAALRALIADDHAAADRLVTAGMNVLTQVARRGGVTAVIAELAHRIDGWAVLLDAHGQVIATAGAGRLHVSDAVAVALGRPVRVRHDGLQLHRVGSEQDLAGSLVIATRSSRTSHARDLSSLAAALFDLLLRSHDPSLTEHLGRGALLDTLVAGGERAAGLLHRWGVHERSLTAFELGTRTRTIDPDRLLRRWFDELGAEHVFAADHGHVRGFVRDDLVAGLAARVREFAPVAGLRVHLGLGSPAPVEALARSAAQAHQALEAALEDGRPAVSYAELPSVARALDAVGDGAQARLTTLLEPLRDAAGAPGELAETLRVYLTEHGAHRASAARLGIHRQTLVSRIRRIEDLTGLAMDRADDRAAAWLALRAIGL